MYDFTTKSTQNMISGQFSTLHGWMLPKHLQIHERYSQSKWYQLQNWCHCGNQLIVSLYCATCVHLVCISLVTPKMIVYWYKRLHQELELCRIWLLLIGSQNTTSSGLVQSWPTYKTIWILEVNTEWYQVRAAIHNGMLFLVPWVTKQDGAFLMVYNTCLHMSKHWI